MVPFGPWRPDLATFDTLYATEALGVYPSPTGYRPLNSFVNTASALTGRCRGAFTALSSTGTVFNFAGDGTKLYKQASTGASWADVSRTVGGAYATATEGFWTFMQFGDIVFASNGVDDIQSFTMGSSTNFAAATGSPAIGAFLGNVKGFGVIARLSSNVRTMIWSGQEDVTTWTPSATTLSDDQTFPDGGAIMGFAGGDVGIVFQESAIQRMQFVGPPLAFRFDKISTNLGCNIPRSIASYQDMVFALSTDGFIMVQGGTSVNRIGYGKLDDWIFRNINQSYLNRCSAVVDPVRMVYCFGFVSNDNSTGIPDQFVMYHWATGEWAHAPLSHELLWSASIVRTGTDIDSLDALYPGGIDTVPFSLDAVEIRSNSQQFLAAFDDQHRSGFFTGNYMSATIETGETELTPGRKTLLRGLRPMIEGTAVTPSVTVKYRDRLQDAPSSSVDVTTNANGICPFRVNARYHRAQMSIPANSTWQFARGIDALKVSQMGAR
jgi:hypothetical protein